MGGASYRYISGKRWWYFKIKLLQRPTINVNYGWMMWKTLVMLCCLYTRATRWQIMLHPSAVHTITTVLVLEKCSATIRQVCSWVRKNQSEASSQPDLWRIKIQSGGSKENGQLGLGSGAEEGSRFTRPTVDGWQTLPSAAAPGRSSSLCCRSSFSPKSGKRREEICHSPVTNNILQQLENVAKLIGIYNNVVCEISKKYLKSVYQF